MKKRLFVAVSFLVLILAILLLWRLLEHIFVFYPKWALRLGKGVPVEVEKVKVGEMTLVVWGSGSIESLRKINYSVNFDGVVKKIFVKVGDVVKPGDKLLEIEDSLLKKEFEVKKREVQQIRFDLQLFKKNEKKREMELQEKVNSALKRLDFLKKKVSKIKEDLKNAQDLYLKKMLSYAELQEKELLYAEVEADYRHAYADYLTLKHQLENFQENRYLTLLEKEKELEEAHYELEEIKSRLEQTVVRSTVKGLVSQIPVNTGEKFGKNQTLMVVNEIDPIFARIFMAQEYSSFISKGQEVKIFLQAWPREEFVGRIYTLETIDKKVKALPVWVKLENERLKLRPGLAVHGLLKLQFYGVLVPEVALLGTGDNLYVFVVEKGVARIRQVKILVRNGRYALVLSGVSEGDEVVVSGQLNLLDGIKVIKNAYQVHH